jgi:hypothetical protein
MDEKTRADLDDAVTRQGIERASREGGTNLLHETAISGSQNDQKGAQGSCFSCFLFSGLGAISRLGFGFLPRPFLSRSRALSVYVPENR